MNKEGRSYNPFSDSITVFAYRDIGISTEVPIKIASLGAEGEI
jgi:hypothetical protein